VWRFANQFFIGRPLTDGVGVNSAARQSAKSLKARRIPNIKII
jgi:hypothetical protein